MERNNQLIHEEVKKSTHNKEIIVIADNLRTPENIGMLFRVSEAFGVKKVVLIGSSWDLTNRKIIRTARSTTNNLSITQLEESTDLINELRNENFVCLALELTNNSIPIKEYKLNTNKVALIIGAERQGVQDEILQKVHQAVHIDLFGKNSSINVVNALTAGLYEITR